MRESLIGSLIDGTYEVKEFIGAGGYGQVFRVTRRPDGAQLALKLLSELDDQSVRELKAMTELDHPNLIEYFDSGALESGQPYIVMELAEGTLSESLAQGPLDEGQAWDLAEAVAAGLASLHAQKHIHRDLKPQNVLRCGHSWKLGDLGLTREYNSKVTRASKLGGTFTYIAPESFSGQTGPAVDVWAFGILLHEALTGKLPFPEGVEQRMRAIISGQVALVEMVPDGFRALLEACLQPIPEQRPNASELLRQISEKGQAEAVSEPSGATEPSPVSQRADSRRTLTPVALVAVVALLLGGLYTYGARLATQPMPATETPVLPNPTATQVVSKPETILLKVAVLPAEATLLLDGEPFPDHLEAGSGQADLLPGKYRLEASHPDHIPLTRDIELKEGDKTIAIPIVLGPRATPTPSPTPVKVTVSARPAAARLSIDGEGDFRLPWRGTLPAGEHVFKVHHSGYITVERKVALEQRQQQINFDLERRSSPPERVTRPPSDDFPRAYPTRRPRSSRPPAALPNPRPRPRPRPNRTWHVD